MKVEYKAGVLTITIPCGEKEIKAAQMSKSGKSKMVATTSGFVPVEGAPEGVRLSLNLIAK